MAFLHPYFWPLANLVCQPGKPWGQTSWVICRGERVTPGANITRHSDLLQTLVEFSLGNPCFQIFKDIPQVLPVCQQEGMTSGDY